VEAARHDADLVAGREQAEDEVVVLGPAGVAVAERAEHVASHHERRCATGHSTNASARSRAAQSIAFSQRS
jgi:hypothetical protein